MKIANINDTILRYCTWYTAFQTTQINVVYNVHFIMCLIFFLLSYVYEKKSTLVFAQKDIGQSWCFKINIQGSDIKVMYLMLA